MDAILSLYECWARFISTNEIHFFSLVHYFYFYASQFENETVATVMSWVPRKLAPQMRVVLSMTNDSPEHETIRQRESKAQELHRTPLDMDSRKVSCTGKSILQYITLTVECPHLVSIKLTKLEVKKLDVAIKIFLDVLPLL